MAIEWSGFLLSMTITNHHLKVLCQCNLWRKVTIYKLLSLFGEKHYLSVVSFPLKCFPDKLKQQSALTCVNFTLVIMHILCTPECGTRRVSFEQMQTDWPSKDRFPVANNRNQKADQFWLQRFQLICKLRGLPTHFKAHFLLSLFQILTATLKLVISEPTNWSDNNLNI